MKTLSIMELSSIDSKKTVRIDVFSSKRIFFFDNPEKELKQLDLNAIIAT